MYLIGKGAQYRVYDTLDGRVLKKLLTHAETFEIMAEWHASGNVPINRVSEDYTLNAINASKSFKRLIADYPELRETLGNPLFLDETSYSQDKVQPIGNSLTSVNLEQGKSIIDAYVHLIITHWRYGFCDKVFNFTINNGIDSYGNVVLIDFGEVSFLKSDIVRRIHNQRWLQAWSYLKDFPEMLKNYYVNKMKEDITTRKLIDVWKASL